MSNEQKVTRKLRAILSADVKGYSLLIADDEVHTIATLKKYRSLMSDLIQQYSGRVVDNPGDNLLAEFSSALDAVDCAVQIQHKLWKENAKYVEDSRLKYRIGVNIGDVVQDGERIYGEGVNIAARIESLAVAGGICISRSTYDQIKNKLELNTEYLGEHEVKNIKEPVRVYKVLMGTDAPKPMVAEQLELPDIPSIAVLPFNNMSGDPGQEYFSDGMTEQIINGLCKVSNLFVIARNSSFAYKGKSISVKQLATELGVRYILEGSVQKAGSRVRITAQLIDAVTDFHLWSENYDRDLEDIFALQDEITMKLISVMEVNLVYGEQARLWGGITTKNIRAYDKCMRGNEHIVSPSKRSVEQARKFAEEAISIDNTYAFAYNLLGWTHGIDLMGNWSEDRQTSLREADINAKKALDLWKNFDLPHSLSGFIYLMKGLHDDAITEAKKAVALNPNGADAHAHLGFIFIYSGHPEKAVDLFKIAFRLNPIPPPYYCAWLGIGYAMTGRFSEALKEYNKAVQLYPDYAVGYILLATSYSLYRQYDRASEYIEKALKLWPQYSVDLARLSAPHKHSRDLDIFLNALRKTGLPEHSPE